MKRNIFCLFTLLVLLFTSWSCGKDNEGDNDSQEETTYTYSVNVRNTINKSKISSNISDGVLYDVFVFTEKGDFYSIGDIENGKMKKIEFTNSQMENVQFCILLKLGRSKQSANIKNFCSPAESPEKWRRYRVEANSNVEIYITEETAFYFFDYTHIGELRNIVTSYLLTTK
ncbi:MAG: hypothetical protein IJ693_00750 [Bacteroidaceae bacterium]|nr:hypothetical protein [Bacteroidaceae bacterium]